ncbi:hypothetical protein EVAR_57866_1 [Eumeta japonica]|uniref:(+)RNA virus helicase C-terminal domain-containing protein n=1 Tax=Eumeta variegata TaxID=151549 RepID=A0A4C1ZFG9_EUMVA|nr:hypothetical protein EVAR_57866_1 [Eumeta japonica]
MTRDTKVALEERILRTMKKLSKENDQDYSETFTDWETPKITWINGVPGCGKTTWIVQEFDNKRDCIVTATIEAAEDLKRKLANRIGAEATTRVRTMASVLVNGFKEHTHNRLLIDEAMMNHFGAIITAALLAKAKELLLIGDINQIPHIDRHNVFPMSYEKPNAVAKVSRELLRSYRNPMDVAYALNEIYSGIYSTQEGTRSLTMDGYDRNKLSISLPQTLYLAHTSWQNRAKSHGMRTRLKLKDSPYCACDPAKMQDVLHVLEKRPMFLRDHVTRNCRHCIWGSAFIERWQRGGLQKGRQCLSPKKTECPDSKSEGVKGGRNYEENFDKKRNLDAVKYPGARCCRGRRGSEEARGGGPKLVGAKHRRIGGAGIGEFALRLKESRLRYMIELGREKARRARELETAEKMLEKISQDSLDRVLKLEPKIYKMAVEISSTRNILGHNDVPEKLDAIQKVVESRPVPQPINYAEAAAKPKPKIKETGNAEEIEPEPRSGPSHTLIISSKYENRLADQVGNMLRSVVDAREMRVAVDRAKNQKVVLSCSSAEDIKKIEDRIRIYLDEDIIKSLRIQNRHIFHGLDWGRVRVKACYRRRARNDFECHSVLEANAELYDRLIGAGYIYMGLQRCSVWDQSPLVQYSCCLGYGHGKRYCKDVSE